MNTCDVTIHFRHNSNRMAVFGFLGRSLIAMASDEVGVELGRETVDRCRDALQMAEEKQV